MGSGTSGSPCAPGGFACHRSVRHDKSRWLSSQGILLEFSGLADVTGFTVYALPNKGGGVKNCAADSKIQTDGRVKVMRVSWAVMVVALAVAMSGLGWGQSAEGGLPQGLNELSQTASSKTEFTLDHSMLVLASKLDSGDEDFRRVIAGVSGVSIHRYHFAEPGTCDPAALQMVKDEYHNGWKQLVNKHERDGGPDATNLWLRFENDAISNVAVLVARANEVTLITVSGSISPLDLAHLGGHFGIPRIEGGLRLPDRGRSSQ